MDREFFGQLSAAARAAIRQQIEAGLDSHSKTSVGFDPVTAADREAERLIREIIKSRFHEHGISGEEFSDHQPSSSVRWSLDPVDGTRALICGLPSWAVLVGLTERAKAKAFVPAAADRWPSRASRQRILSSFRVMKRWRSSA